jgi:hypothetical protein
MSRPSGFGLRPGQAVVGAHDLPGDVPCKGAAHVCTRYHFPLILAAANLLEYLPLFLFGDSRPIVLNTHDMREVCGGQSDRLETPRKVDPHLSLSFCHRHRLRGRRRTRSYRRTQSPRRRPNRRHGTNARRVFQSNNASRYSPFGASSRESTAFGRHDEDRPLG